MKILKRIFLFYCLLVSLFLTVTAPTPLQIIFLPSIAFLTASGLKKKAGFLSIFKAKAFAYFNFIIICLMVVTGFIGIKSTADLISALLFTPLALYFVIKIFPRRKHSLVLPEILPNPEPVIDKKPPKERILLKEEPVKADFDPDFDEIRKREEFDKNRRVFIKLIGSAGISLFVFSLFTKKAQAAFFGSVPGPGTISIKDSTGTVIDPAKNHPTDGYKVSELDDSSPAYYGFTDKDGNWFILKETSGVYRYVKGSSSFSTNWTNRASLSYDYYHNVF